MVWIILLANTDGLYLCPSCCWGTHFPKLETPRAPDSYFQGLGLMLTGRGSRYSQQMAPNKTRASCSSFLAARLITCLGDLLCSRAGTHK